jgi:hypothetical protein
MEQYEGLLAAIRPEVSFGVTTIRVFRLVALENNPLTESEKESALAAIRHSNPGVAMEFWVTLLS